MVLPQHSITDWFSSLGASQVITYSLQSVDIIPVIIEATGSNEEEPSKLLENPPLQRDITGTTNGSFQGNGVHIEESSRL